MRRRDEHEVPQLYMGTGGGVKEGLAKFIILDTERILKLLLRNALIQFKIA